MGIVGMMGIMGIVGDGCSDALVCVMTGVFVETVFCGEGI